MPVQKLELKPGVDRENTRYSSEGGWYECDKIRFRDGTPEKIGGWQRISNNTFLGVCRSLWNWVTLASENIIGVGTNLKFYLSNGGVYYDITPIRASVSLTNPFATSASSTTVTVTDANGGYVDGDFVTFSGGSAVGGITISGEHQISIVFTTANTYTIQAASAASSSATGGGSVTAAYQINTGKESATPALGWGASYWGSGTWGTGTSSEQGIRLWSQSNFGEDLIFGPRGGGLFLWDASGGFTSRGAALSGTGVPTVQDLIHVSDISRFVFAFGCNPLGSATANPLLVRWSAQEDATQWTPAATNQAGSVQLSIGSKIVAVKQARQEVLVWSDSALYALQYVGAPIVWGSQLVGENISIASQNAVAYANGVAYWMGVDKFYMYDGRTQPLACSLRKFIFNDFSTFQYDQVFAGTVESFHEIWWFYCSASSETADRYVVYNYMDSIWYYGTMARTAWLDSGLRDSPLAATYSNNLVDQESGVDDDELGQGTAIAAFAETAQFDLDDGHQFSFISRILPDITFDGSTIESPTALMTLKPLQNSGSGYSSPASVGGSNSGTITRTATLPIEKFTGQLDTRVRGRQMIMKIESSDVGVTWQLGSPRLDIRPDGETVMPDNTDYDIPFKAPALPLPPAVYEQRYFDGVNNVLRIYFNQLDQALRSSRASDQAEATGVVFRLMANTYTNAKVDLTTTNVTTLYTCATSTTGIVKSILVSEDSGNADTITVTLTTAASAVFSLFKTKSVGANATVELLTEPLVVQTGEILKVTAATANRLHVVASILEIT